MGESSWVGANIEDYNAALAEGTAAEYLHEKRLEGNYWAAQKIDVAWNEGSDSFRRNSTYISHFFTFYMRKMGLINESQQMALTFIVMGLEMTFGLIIGLGGIVAFYENYKNWLVMRAIRESQGAVASGPPGWARVAFAAAMTASVCGGLYAGTQLNEVIHNPPDIRSMLNFGSAMGNVKITTEIRQAMAQELASGGWL